MLVKVFTPGIWGGGCGEIDGLSATSLSSEVL